MIEVSGDVVRLDNADFFRLVHEPEAPEHREALSVPDMAEGLEAVRAPLIHVDVLIAGAARVARHHVWLTEGVALFLLTVREPTRQVLVTPPGHVPSGLARMLRLGPRPTPAREPMTVDGADLEKVFDVEDADATDVRESLLESWESTGAWSVVVAYGEEERRTLFLDGPQGLRLVLPDPEPPTPDEAWQAVPISATTAWRQLCSLLPADADLASRDI